jgi:hypothetical protein
MILRPGFPAARCRSAAASGDPVPVGDEMARRPGHGLAIPGRPVGRTCGTALIG